ncbi:MAG: glycosyltransferase [Paracoccaceae bacterium]
MVIPEFPQQTHIAWWRVGDAFRGLGWRMRLVSTKRPPASLRVHRLLDDEARRTHYLWPPRPRAVLAALARPAALARGVAYVLGLGESGLGERLRLLPLVLCAADLRDLAEREDASAIFVHSCANAAHVAALCRRMGGPRYALRLGGDLAVYGKDHRSKMAGADFVLSASPTYFDELERDVGVEHARLRWSWVGTDLSRCAPGDDWPAPADPARLEIVSVARLNPPKGHADVLRALARLRDEGVDARYTLVGAGPHEAAIRASIEELGLGDRVVLAGSKDAAEVVRALQGSDVLVLASFGAGEAAPAVVCEAMACGLPVICTRIGATALMVRDGVDGVLVDQRDVGAIAAALRRLAAEPETLAAMKRAAHERSVAFDVRRTAEGILDAFGLARPGEPASDPDRSPAREPARLS